MRERPPLIDDPLIRVASNRKIPPLLIWIVSTTLPTIYFGLLAYVTGNFMARGEYAGFLEDYNFMNSLFVGVPVAVTFYFTLNNYVTECMEGLVRNGVFSVSNGRYTSIDHFLRDMRRSLSSLWWPLLAFAFSLAFVLLAQEAHRGIKSWRSQNAVAFVSMEALWLISFWFAITFALRGIASIIWINRAFRAFKIRVRPMHPDGCGGLAPLGRFSVHLGYIISAIGFIMAANQMTARYLYHQEYAALNTVILALGWLLYLVISPIAFFAPIGAAHDAMSQAKEQELMRIAAEFERSYRVLTQTLGEDYNAMRGPLRKLREIERLYRIVDGFPVWPFQAQKLGQFALSVVSPLGLTIVSTVIAELITRYL